MVGTRKEQIMDILEQNIVFYLIIRHFVVNILYLFMLACVLLYEPFFKPVP